jgi:hypothetical protein
LISDCHVEFLLPFPVRSSCPANQLAKAIHDYSKDGDDEGGLRKVQDIVRGTIMCSTVKEMKRVMAALETDPRVEVLRFKNLFRDLDPTHFRRFAVNFSVVVEMNDGKEPHYLRHIVELQIHLRQFFEYKHKNKTAMHGPYEYFREGGKKEIVMPRLQKQMDALTEIAQTPVLLSMFCTTVEGVEGGRPLLPTSPSEMYESALEKRLEGRGGLKRVLQIAAFDNFTNGNRREFTVEDVRSAIGPSTEVTLSAAELSNMLLGQDRGDPAPLLKALDVTTGLLQFSHLSFQEGLASQEARRQIAEGTLEREEGDFARQHLLSKTAVNFLRLYPVLEKDHEDGEDGCIPFLKKITKGDFSNDFTPKDFLFNLGRFDRPCRIFDTMAHLDLQAANIDGEREFVQSHVVTWSNISKIAPSYSLDVVRPRLTNFFFNYFLVPFIGSIPESFGQLGNLVELNLSRNKLEGQFFSIFEAVSAD